MVADPPANRRERVLLLEKLPGFQESSLPDQDHGPLDILTCRAPFVAGRNLILEPRA